MDSHNIILENRNRLSISGVTDVEGFDDNSVSIYTVMGDLVIRGKKLKVEAVNIETGEMLITGEVKSLVWGDKDRTKKPTLWQKLIRLALPTTAGLFPFPMSLNSCFCQFFSEQFSARLSTFSERSG